MVSLITGFSSTAFRRVELWANGKLVKEWTNYTYMAFIAYVTNFNATYLKTVLKRIGAWALDTNDGDDPTMLANKGALICISVINMFNLWTFLGLVIRRQLIQQSRLCDMMSRAFVPAFTTNRLIPGASNFRLIFNCHKLDYSLIVKNTETKAFRMKLMDAFLHVNYIELTSIGLSTVQRYLNSGLKYPYLDYSVTSFSVTSVAEYRSPNVQSKVHPRRLFLMMCLEDSYLGSKFLNPLHFNNFGLNSLTLSVNGKLFETKIDFSKKKETLAQAYLALCNACAAYDRSFTIDLLTFMKCYTVFAWDLTSSNAGACPYTSLSSEQAVWYFGMEFKAKLTETIQVLTIEEYEAVMNIDKDYEVSLT